MTETSNLMRANLEQAIHYVDESMHNLDNASRILEEGNIPQEDFKMIHENLNKSHAELAKVLGIKPNQDFTYEEIRGRSQEIINERSELTDYFNRLYQERSRVVKTTISLETKATRVNLENIISYLELRLGSEEDSDIEVNLDLAATYASMSDFHTSLGFSEFLNSGKVPGAETNEAQEYLTKSLVQINKSVGADEDQVLTEEEMIERINRIVTERPELKVKYKNLNMMFAYVRSKVARNNLFPYRDLDSLKQPSQYIDGKSANFCSDLLERIAESDAEKLVKRRDKRRIIKDLGVEGRTEKFRYFGFHRDDLRENLLSRKKNAEVIRDDLKRMSLDYRHMEDCLSKIDGDLEKIEDYDRADFFSIPDGQYLEREIKIDPGLEMRYIHFKNELKEEAKKTDKEIDKLYGMDRYNTDLGENGNFLRNSMNNLRVLSDCKIDYFDELLNMTKGPDGRNRVYEALTTGAGLIPRLNGK